MGNLSLRLWRKKKIKKEKRFMKFHEFSAENFAGPFEGQFAMLVEGLLAAGFV